METESGALIVAVVLLAQRTAEALTKAPLERSGAAAFLNGIASDLRLMGDDGTFDAIANGLETAAEFHFSREGPPTN